MLPLINVRETRRSKSRMANLKTKETLDTSHRTMTSKTESTTEETKTVINTTFTKIKIKGENKSSGPKDNQLLFLIKSTPCYWWSSQSGRVLSVTYITVYNVHRGKTNYHNDIFFYISTVASQITFAVIIIISYYREQQFNI